MVAEHSRKEIWINAIISVLQGVLPFVVIVCIKSLVDYLTKPSALSETEQLWFIATLIVTALVFLANGVITEIRTYFSEKLSQSIVRNIYNKLHQKHTSLDLSHFENPKELDKTHRAVQEASFRPIKIINELLTP